MLAPTKLRYLDLVVDSERTPESVQQDIVKAFQVASGLLERAFRAVANLVKAAWGAEVFSSEETSAENEISVVQWASLCGAQILLTGDAGRAALTEAADYAPVAGLVLPGIYRFQVPHHGSRRNVSTEILDRWVGPRLPSRPATGSETWTAIISSAKEDTDHPRKSVVRALIHRGASVIATEGQNIYVFSQFAPPRAGDRYSRWRTQRSRKNELS